MGDAKIIHPSSLPRKGLSPRVGTSFKSVRIVSNQKALLMTTVLDWTSYQHPRTQKGMTGKIHTLL
jgi:hypothetical protein